MDRIAVDAGNVRLSGLFRRGNGPGIVFLHGLCGGAVHFDGAYEHAELEQRSLLAVDLPGFGKSGNIPSPSVEDMAGAVGSAVAALGFERYLLVAHSMASSVAARLFSRASGVVLLEGNLLPSHLDFSNRIIQVPRDAFSGEFTRMQRTAKMIMRYQTKLTEGTALDRYAQTFSDCSAETVWDVASAINADVRAGGVIGRFASSGPPLTCLYGTDGAYAGTIHDIAQRLPDASHRAISRAAHYPMLDSPDETYGVIARVWKEVAQHA